MTGVVLPFWLDRPPLEAVAMAERADRLGYDELWMGELYHFDAFALAAHVVAKTHRIRPVIGPVAAGVRDPVTIARAHASVSELAGRPVRLALGASNRVVVERFHGRNFSDEPERMRAVVDRVRTQARTGRAPSGYRSALGPSDIHITVAAFGPRMVRVAKEVGDRMVVNLVTPMQAGALAQQAGIATVAWVVAAVEPGPATRAQVAGQIVHYLGAAGYREMFRGAGFGDLVDQALEGRPLTEMIDAIPVELLQAVTMYGSASDVRAAHQRYLDSGVGVAIVPATADDAGGMRTLALFQH